jgi:hypothetical protein
MRRLFWLGLGIGLGVLIMRRLNQIAERLTPKGMASTMGNALVDLVHEVREFTGELRATMGEREQELRTGTGLDAPAAAPGGSGSR